MAAVTFVIAGRLGGPTFLGLGWRARRVFTQMARRRRDPADAAERA